MVGRRYQSIINQYCDDDVIIQQLIRDETEIVAQSAKLWKHELENDIILNTGTPDLMYQTIGLLMDCFINGINKNKKRAQCLMKKIKKIMNEKMEEYFETFSGNDDDYIWMQVKSSDISAPVKIKKEDSKYFENEMKEKGYEVIRGNDFAYKILMDDMKAIHDELELYNNYMYLLTGEIDKIKM